MNAEAGVRGTQSRLIRPFTALRYRDVTRLSDRIAPPYDVISPDERRELAARDECNMVALTLPVGGAGRYTQAADTLQRWIGDRVLAIDSVATVTLVQQTFCLANGTAYVRSGLCAAVTAEPYETGCVRPHERTHRGPKQDRLALMRATRTVLEPLFMLSRDADGALRRFIDRETRRAPAAEARLGEVDVCAWIVPAARAADVLTSLHRDVLYIADGHHRFETAVTYRNEDGKADFVLGFIVPVSDPGLIVLPTHRVIHGERVDPTALAFPSGEGEHKPHAGTCTVLWGEGSESVVQLEPTRSTDVADTLAIARVEAQVVQPIVRAAGAAARVSYTPDAERAWAAVRAGAAAAVLVEPTAVEDVLAVADAGGYMPPKSTYFYPKVPSGVVLAPVAER